MKSLIPYGVKDELSKFYKTTQRAYFFGLVTHFSVCFFGWGIGVWELALFNILISVPSFTAAIILNRLGKHYLAFSIAFFELYFHQVVGVYYLGWVSGLQLWLVYLASLTFFNPGWKKKMNFSILFLIVTTYSLLYLFAYEGVYSFDKDFIRYTYLNNSIFVISVISLLIYGYSRDANKAENELKTANAELSGMNEEMQSQNEEIQSQNDEIFKSINYAERIQNAMIPHTGILNSFMPDNFVLFQPKDIVSGDFYWFSDRKDQLVVVCADCTGHGVPGGFMSMLGISLLNEISSHEADISPAELLEHLRTKVKESLGQNRLRYPQKDGMDASVCLVDKKTKTLTFAGANNGLFLVRNSKLTEYKPTKNPIGAYTREVPFKEEVIPLEDGDAVYMYTDGYLDQFGGANGMKYLRKRLRSDLVELSHLSMKEQGGELSQRFRKWKSGYDQIDDCTLIGLRFHA